MVGIWLIQFIQTAVDTYRLLVNENALNYLLSNSITFFHFWSFTKVHISFQATQCFYKNVSANIILYTYITLDSL